MGKMIGAPGCAGLVGGIVTIVAGLALLGMVGNMAPSPYVETLARVGVGLILLGFFGGLALIFVGES